MGGPGHHGDIGRPRTWLSQGMWMGPGGQRGKYLLGGCGHSLGPGKSSPLPPRMMLPALPGSPSPRPVSSRGLRPALWTAGAAPGSLPCLPSSLSHSQADHTPHTCHGEVVQRGQALLRCFRLLLVPDEGPVALQQEVPGSPRFDVFTWKAQGLGAKRSSERSELLLHKSGEGASWKRRAGSAGPASEQASTAGLSPTQRAPHEHSLLGRAALHLGRPGAPLWSLQCAQRHTAPLKAWLGVPVAVAPSPPL